MSRPVSLFAAMELVRRSGLLSDTALKRWSNESQFAGDSPDGYFRKLVDGGALTPFQARQLAAGRWRGLVVENYTLSECIGSGGTGRVYLGKHRQRDQSVAIKVLTPECASDPTARARLRREARAAASLDHPNIVRVTHFDVEHDPPYLIMEYVKGESLQALVARTGTFTANAAALCGRQVALGLQHAWERGLVHRDIKPANVLLDREGAVKILDLGIVSTNQETGLTLSNSQRRMILGTVDYLAPEQADDSSNVDCRADIYALGSTLFFLLAGHPPFTEESPTARLARKQMSDAVRLDCLRPDVPVELAKVVAKMMARDPDQRYATPQEAADALAPWAVPVQGFPVELFLRLEAAEAAPGKKFDPKASLKLSGSSIHRSLTKKMTAAGGEVTREASAASLAGDPTVQLAVQETHKVASPSKDDSNSYACAQLKRRPTSSKAPPRRKWVAATAVALAIALIFTAGFVLRPWLR